MNESLPTRLASERERLLDALQDQLAGAAVADGPSRRPASQQAPASFAQRRLWFLDKLSPGSAAYNVPTAIRLHGAVDTEALDQAVREVVARHEVLRTTFSERDGEPVQVVADPGGIRLAIDPEELDPADLPRWLPRESFRPFDLTSGPLLRCVLRRLSPKEHILLVNAHHIVVDGWSLGILLDELRECYEAFTAGRAPDLKLLPMRYADFASWQREQEDSGALAGDLAYWREALAGAPPTLPLPTDGARTGAAEASGAVLTRAINPALAARVRDLGAAEGATTFMTVLAAFQLLLGRLSGTSDVVVGAPIAGRSRPELEPLIGHFLNTLALRADLSGELAFRELLGRVRQTVMAAFAHQELPFEQLVEVVQPEQQQRGDTPVFQVLVNHTPAAPLPDRMGDLGMELIELAEAPPKFPLTLYVRPDGDDQSGLLLEALFQDQVFSRDRIAGMLGQFEHLLDQVTADPGRPITGYSLVTPEAAAILPDRASPLERQPTPSVRDMIESWVSATPDAAAVRWGEATWSYQELWRRAETIRQCLAEHGVSAPATVAVTGPRTPGLIAAMVAVLAGGGVLLTIDPRLPRLRQQVMLTEANAAHLLLADADPGATPVVTTAGLGVTRVDPSSGAPAAGQPCAVPPAVTGEDDPAYVFFTSGTTGVPKGVLGRRAGLAHFLAWQRDTFDVGPGDRCAHLTGLSFDVVLRDVLLPLVSGATLCVPTEGEEMPPERVLSWLAEQEITCVHTVPALARAWLAGRAAAAAPRQLRLSFFAGEPLTGELARAWRSVCGAATVVNLYGPTETTLAICAYVVPADCTPGVQPIGAAIPGAQALITGPGGTPCGIGEVGEIVIRTPYRSLGYINGDERSPWTANPASSAPGDLLYRTGDLGRYRLDGSIDILGRTDRQVKIRGVRVELDEIAALAARHPTVEQAVVVSRPDDEGHPALAAYLVAPSRTPATATQLRGYLGKRLPAAMLPSALVFVDEIPRTANGKTDWRALPPLEPDSENGAEFTEPRDAAEREIAGIMAGLLRRDRVGAHDSFFALGGHSLLATQLVSRIASALGVTLPLRTVFETPTVAEIAAAVTAAAATTAAPTSFAQRRLWFLDRLEPGNPAYNVPVAARLRGELDVTALRRALTRITARHEVLRTTLREVDGEPVQVIGAPAEVPLPVRDISGAGDPAAAIDAAMSADGATPFDLTAGPLLRCALLRVRSDDHVLLVTAHHAVTDGWSLGVFFLELSTLYASFHAGRGDPLPPLAVQYGDYAAWQREFLTAELLESDRDYWRAALAGAPARLDLPTQFPRQGNQAGAGAIITSCLPAQLAADVCDFSEAEGATVFMTLLAAFQLTLARHAGATDVVVGSPSAGRLRPELEPMIGCFVNLLPLRADISGSPSFRDVLGRVRGAALDAYEHQNLSFEQIVDTVRPDRAVTGEPLFQVLFAVNNMPTPPLSAGALTVEFLPLRHKRAKYDLSVTATCSGDEIDLAAEYRGDLYGADWVNRFLDHYRVILAAAIAGPQRAVDELPMLPAAERQRLLDGWNDTATDFPDDVCVHELVERQVSRTPDAVAVTAEAGELTFRELDERANQIARQLREWGIGRDSRVGVCLERSLEMVAALLGVLKAGAAYVPLDPAYPATRLEQMTADAGIEAVVAHAATRDVVPPGAPRVLDLGRADLSGLPVTAPPPAAGPSDSAYVIYTSGSTGRPKGVVNTHRGAVNRLVWTQREYRLDAADVVLQKTPYSFDVSVWEFFWPLITGARLVMARPGGHKDPRYLASLIRDERVTTLHFVPSMLLAFMETVDIADCASLRRVITSGEALPADLARRFVAAGLDCPLHNLYGPTEAAIDVSHWTCQPDEPGPTVPIGRPVANTQLYILDPRGEPVPIGVTGELCIGGVQVAAGYLNQPELTAERFTPNPFHGGTMYRTGDLARWRQDGAAEFLGRLDHQVKLRGFRIELGDVEAAIRAQDGVRAVVVTARRDQLVAYVAGDPAALSSEELRERVGRERPEYMVPSVIVWLDELPLLPNGKVDRKALPEPGDLTAPATGRVPPRDGLELELITLWEELLDVRPIGVTDDFFALGGNSLQVIRLLSRITRQHGQELPVSVMFSGGATVERLARELRRDPATRKWSPVVAIRPAGARPPLFCLPPAVGNVLCYVDLARSLPAGQPVYGLQAAGLDASRRPLRHLAESVAEYTGAIRSIQPDGPYHLAGYCVGSVSAFAVARRLREAGQEVAVLAMLDGGPPSVGNGFDDADEADIAAWFAWELGRAAGRRLVIEPADLRAGTGQTLAEVLLAAAVARDVLPGDTDASQLARLLATFDAGVRAAREHEARPFDGRIVGFRAEEEPADANPVTRWRPLAAGGLVIEDVPGDHYSMMRPPQVAVLAGALDRVLADGGRGEQR
jgi:amino acid adenylation domain-containing protein